MASDANEVRADVVPSAFRLWHASRDYSHSASECFPGQRWLANDIGCNIHALKGWTAELVTAGGLKVEPDLPGGDLTTPFSMATASRCGKWQRK